MRCFLTSAPSRTSASARSASGASSMSASGGTRLRSPRRARARPAPPRQQIEPRREQRVDRRRQLELRQVAHRDPAPVVPTHTSLLDQHRDELSTKSGLPAATSATRSLHAGVERRLRRAGRRRCCCSSSRTAARARFARGRRSPTPGSARRGRAARRRRRGLRRSCTAATRWSTRSRNVVSAQCTSSTIDHDGLLVGKMLDQLAARPRTARRARTARSRGRLPRSPALRSRRRRRPAREPLGRELRRVLLEDPGGLLHHLRTGQNVIPRP